MELQLQRDPEFGSRRRRGLAISALVHLMVLSLFAFNPDFLRSTPRRVIRIAADEPDEDRFEVLELFLPPELVPQRPPEPPAIAEAPPAAVVEPPPPPAPEAAPPPPPPIPPPVIGPDDVVAEGARPDAPVPAEANAEPDAEEAEEAAETTELAESIELDPGGEAGEGLEDSEGEAGTVAEVEEGTETEPQPEPLPSVVEAPGAPSVTLPNLRTRAESLINEVLDEERRRAGVGGGLGGLDRRDQPPNLSADATQILSDTRGYDFGPYMNQVINRVRQNWYRLIPEAARLAIVRGRVVLTFTIVADGRVENLQIQAGSGTDSLDNAALGAIQLSNPFQRIPLDFEGRHLTLQFTFLYNLDTR